MRQVFPAGDTDLQSLDSYQSGYTSRFKFDLSGPVLAEHMRAQLEDHLQQNGELPMGIHLSTPEQFRDAVGTGEIWQPENVLPFAFMGLLGLGVFNSKSKHIYTEIVMVVIFSMVITPLIHSYQV